MKTVGILVGRERSFPDALISAIEALEEASGRDKDTAAIRQVV